MAQIGLVCLGIFILDNNFTKKYFNSFNINVWILLNLYTQGESNSYIRKIYFRFGKLKCKVSMKNEVGIVVCTGEIAGMIV
jgi:3-hydroxyacyl-[acyl-carrier-protein] dehydratase